MKLLFTVCGRAGSKGLKNKNISHFLGYPLVEYTIAAIRLFKQKHGDYCSLDVCLSTDSDILKEQTCMFMDNIFVICRDEGLCGDTIGKVDVISDCLLRAEKHFETEYDYVIDLDITSPLRTVNNIIAAVEKINTKSVFDVVFSVTEPRRNPYFNMVSVSDDGSCKKVIDSNYTSRQQAPLVYDMNASIYAYKPRYLKERYPASFGFISMMDTAVLDIDSEEDFALMQLIADYIYTTYPEYGEIFREVSLWKRGNN